MTPLPKRRYAKARRGERRSHLALALPSIVECPQCHSKMLSHTVCLTCGKYKGRQVIALKTSKKQEKG